MSANATLLYRRWFLIAKKSIDRSHELDPPQPEGTGSSDVPPEGGRALRNLDRPTLLILGRGTAHWPASSILPLKSSSLQDLKTSKTTNALPALARRNEDGNLVGCFSGIACLQRVCAHSTFGIYHRYCSIPIGVRPEQGVASVLCQFKRRAAISQFNAFNGQ